MKISKEEKILKIIKFSPPIFVLIISIIVVMFLYFENKKTFDIQKKEVEEKYIEKNKSFVKEEVNRVYSYIKYLQENTEKELKNNVTQFVNNCLQNCNREKCVYDHHFGNFDFKEAFKDLFYETGYKEHYDKMIR